MKFIRQIPDKTETFYRDMYLKTLDILEFVFKYRGYEIINVPLGELEKTIEKVLNDEYEKNTTVVAGSILFMNNTYKLYHPNAQRTPNGHYIPSIGCIDDKLDYEFYYKRKVGNILKKDLLSFIKNEYKQPYIFIKPLESKVFPAQVLDTKTLFGYQLIEVLPDETPLIWSEYTPFDAAPELRCYVENKKIKWVSAYTSGDTFDIFWNDDIKRFVNQFIQENPITNICYAVDVGQIKTSQGCLEPAIIELNDFYSLGNYGVSPWDYTRMYLKRWSQMMNIPFESFCYF